MFGRMHQSGHTRYDGTRMRGEITRKVVDYSGPILKMFHSRGYVNDRWNMDMPNPEENFVIDQMPPQMYRHNQAALITTKHAHTSINKAQCVINVAKWTPEGKRLITGAMTGEITLWNGQAFNFETIMQAHDKAIWSMMWTYSGTFLISGDDSGQIKFWQPNMSNVNGIEAHSDSVRGLAFSPNDSKFVSCSEDHLIKIWDFRGITEERELIGHKQGVLSTSWHPSKGIIASGSKDQSIKLWDPRNAENLATFFDHKSFVNQVIWNKNENWLLSASGDTLVKIIDIRMMREMQTFRGHDSEVMCISWHVCSEAFFGSGDKKGTIHFWAVGDSEPIGSLRDAHEGTVTSLDWHPVGHILCSGSKDKTTKFWVRKRPGRINNEEQLNDQIENNNNHQKESLRMRPLPGLGIAKTLPKPPIQTNIPGIGLASYHQR